MDFLPETFVRRLRATVPLQYLPQLFEALQSPLPATFCIQQPGRETEPVLAALVADGIEAGPLPWCERMYRVPAEQRQALLVHPVCRDGHICLLNPTGLMPVIALEPQPGETVMQMGAAPGAGAHCLIDAMQGEGRISMARQKPDDADALPHTLARHGAGMVQVCHCDARRLGYELPAHFDRILLDAPCSSEAHIRAGEPQSWRDWSPLKSREMARGQRALIRAAFDCLKPGGVMIYCTRTYAPEENELVVQSLIDRHADRIGIEPVSLPCPHQLSGLTGWQGQTLNSALAHAVRILPDGVQEAGFLCRIRKY